MRKLYFQVPQNEGTFLQNHTFAAVVEEEHKSLRKADLDRKNYQVFYSSHAKCAHPNPKAQKELGGETYYHKENEVSKKKNRKDLVHWVRNLLKERKSEEKSGP